MDNSNKFSLALDKINAKIAELNIKILKNPEDNSLTQKLNDLLKERDLLYTGTTDELQEIIKKYGENK